MNLSIIVPTLGRPTLARTLSSLVLQPGDEWIVVGDGVRPEARAICKAHDARPGQIHYFETPETLFYGHAQRTFGMQQAHGTHLAFMDDDDVYVVRARQWMELATIRTADKPIIGQVTDRNGMFIWRTKELKLGNISTQMGLFPNVPERLGVWGAKTPRGVRGGDLDFFTTMRWEHNEIVWFPHIFALLRPTGDWNPREFLYGV